MEKSLTHKDIMKLLPADCCRGCPIRKQICKKNWENHPSFQCNGLEILNKIVVASRNE